MRDVLVVGAVLMAAMIGLVHPAVGFFTFVFLGIFSPQSHTWTFGQTVPLSLITAVCTIVGMTVSPERKKLPVQRETILLVALWGLFAISSVLAIYPDRAFNQLIYISKIFLMIVVGTILVNSEERLNTLIKIIAYSIGFYALKAGVSAIIGGGVFLVYGPELSFLYANNSIGLAMAINIPLLYYLYQIEKDRLLKTFLVAIMLFSIPAIIFTYSRGAWLGLVAAIALLFLKMKQKVLIVSFIGLVGVIVMSVWPNIAPERLVTRYDTLVNYEKDVSAESRFWNWEFCRRVGMSRLTGGGFLFESTETYATYYSEFMERWPGKSWTCHSIWFTMLGDHGLGGLVLWILLVLSSVMSVRQLRIAGQSHPELPWLTPLAESIRTSIVVFLIVGTFLDAAYFDLFYYLVAMIVVAKGIVQTSSVPQTVPSTISGGRGEVRHQPAMRWS
jgi:putative inorganic carbon (hco3(-)) transporter